MYFFSQDDLIFERTWLADDKADFVAGWMVVGMDIWFWIFVQVLDQMGGNMTRDVRI